MCQDTQTTMFTMTNINNRPYQIDTKSRPSGHNVFTSPIMYDVLFRINPPRLSL